MENISDQIIKIIDPSRNIDSINATLFNLRAYGISLNGVFVGGKLGLRIHKMGAGFFASEINRTPLALNLHLTIKTALSTSVTDTIADSLAQIESFSSIILSSDQLSRKALNEYRDKAKYRAITEHDEDFNYEPPKIFVASPDDMTNSIEGDMVYANDRTPVTERKICQLADFILSGTPVMVNWPTNERSGITRLYEEVDGSERLLILTRKPQTPKRSINKYMEAR